MHTPSSPQFSFYIHVHIYESAPSPHIRRVTGLIPGPLLCGVCMFSPMSGPFLESGDTPWIVWRCECGRLFVSTWPCDELVQGVALSLPEVSCRGESGGWKSYHSHPGTVCVAVKYPLLTQILSHMCSRNRTVRVVRSAVVRSKARSPSSWIRLTRETRVTNASSWISIAAPCWSWMTRRTGRTAWS